MPSSKPNEAREGATASQGVRLLGLATRAVAFRELPFVPGAVQSAGGGQSVRCELKLQVGVTSKPADPRVAEVTLSVEATPERQFQPYVVHVVLTGFFRAPEGATDQSFAEFCKRTAPVILWPYVRAQISQVTADARFGPVRLDPVNLGAMLKREGWKTGERSGGLAPKRPRSRKPRSE